MGSCLVAFSGGQDSAFLLFHAREVLGDNVTAFTFYAPYTPARDVKDVISFVRRMKIPCKRVKVPLLDSLRYNPANRCYLCKRYTFGMIKAGADNLGYSRVLDGTNADDLNEVRPGINALRELGIESPLARFGISKREICKWLCERKEALGLKPASGCLMTRMPEGHEVSAKELKRIDMAEEYLATQGIHQVRVRSDGKTARIEVPPENRRRFFDEEFLNSVARELKNMGYRYVSLDLDGYKKGNMDLS
ncbi:MAG: ATP-dependent sacrificial sulfur transferase LarE [Syntrophales bacterium]|nr:ATP-dependent sacrificial sulfur transferase LarE [Syntrophales bacterium]